jgi:hypothetical protein
MRRPRFTLACLVLGAAVVLGALQGCEFIVGSSLGTIACEDVPGACPAGQACVSNVCTACAGGTCRPDAAPDVVVPHDTSPPPMEARPEDVFTRDVRDAGAHDASEAAGLKPLGALCGSPAECSSGVCGDSALIVGPTLPGSAVCTKACCTSGECEDSTVKDFVCFPSVGGNYCIDPSLLSLPTPGTGLPGAACSGPGGCRSSVCTDNACQDTCCRDTDCTGSTVCQYSVVEEGQNYNCGPSGGSGGQGADCTFQNCDSNLCVIPSIDSEDDYCFAACCSNADCKDDDNGSSTSCNWAKLNDPDAGQLWTRSCSEDINPGKAGFTMPCKTNTDCLGGLCFKGKSCTIPCCDDSVCGTGSCSYASFPSTSGNVDLQVCVPAGQ